MMIGILQADSVRPQFQDAHGDYPEMFRKLLAAVEPGLEFRDYDVEHGQFPERMVECDGYVITGSKKSVYDDEPWIHELSDYVCRLHREKVKTVGICFGHQIIAQALGGRTQPASAGWGVGVHRSRLIDKPAFVDADVDQFGLLVSHQDQVTVLPEGARLLATSDFCPNAMFRIDDHILTFQGHPEFTRDYSRDLMEMRREMLGEKYDAGIASLKQDPDSDLVARWIVNFFKGP